MLRSFDDAWREAPGAGSHGREAPIGRFRTLRKRETLYRAGDLAGTLYEVVSGSLFIYRLLDDGRRQVVEFVREGALFGFSAGAEHASSCEALEPARLAVHQKSLALAEPELQRRLFRQFECDVGALHDHALTLGRKTAAEKVATLLARMSAAGGGSHCQSMAAGGGPISIRLSMTREIIADYLGLTVETVSRTLTEMERQGLISIGLRRGEIKVASPCRLCRAALSDTCALGPAERPQMARAN